MKKRALSIFLLSILVISCFLYVFPLNSLADTILDSEIAWDLDFSSSSPVVTKFQSVVISHFFNYDSSTGWTSFNLTVNSPISFQLPSPFSSLSDVVVSTNRRFNLVTTYDVYSSFGWGFDGDFYNTVRSLNPHEGDYISLVLPVCFKTSISNIQYTFAKIVSGNSFEPSGLSVDERFLLYNPNSISGVTTSGIIDSSLWDISGINSSYYLCVFYVNIPFSQIQTYSSILSSCDFVVSWDLSDVTSPIYIYEPMLFKSTPTGELTLLSSIDSNIQIISDAVQSHVAPPTNYTDYSSIDQAEAQVSSKVNTIKNTLDDWALTTYISTGLSWVGAYTSYYFNEFGFIQAIYGIIVFFAIANVLRHGFFRTQRDYVTTDNYSVKGHNTQGDYEITGTRTTRRE